MEVDKKDAALRKRQLISNSARQMFMWVAGASVIVGFSLVVAWFLLQQIIYKEKVLAVKATTVSTLKQNNKEAPKLASNIRVLEANEDLTSVKVKPDENAVRVVLDALPSDNNILALGASVQQVLIGGAANVTLESFQVNPSGSSLKISNPNKQAKTIAFNMSLSSSDPNAIKDALKRLESSIRTITIDSMKIEQSDARMSVSVQGHAYYVPSKTIQLKDTVVPVK